MRCPRATAPTRTDDRSWLGLCVILTHTGDVTMASFQTANPIKCGDYPVRPGECASSIAAATGHLWKTIWDHPANASLKAARDPHMLLPGDQIFILPIANRT